MTIYMFFNISGRYITTKICRKIANECNRCLTGLPIGGAILHEENFFYLGLQLFSAVSMIGGGVLIGCSRVVLGGWGLTKKV